MIKKVLLALGIGVFCTCAGLFLMERALLSALDEKGVRFAQMDRGLFSRQFHDLRYRGLKAERVSTTLLRPKTVTIAGLQVTIQPEAGAGKLGVEGPSSLPQDIRAHLNEVSLFWGEDLLVDGLSGEMVDGRIVLEGPNLHLSSGADSLQADWDGPVPFAAISGDTSLHFERGGRIVIAAELPEFTLTHPLLHARPLHLKNAQLHLEGDRLGRRLHGTLSVDGVDLEVRIEREAQSFALDLVLAPTPLDQALSPLARVLPELKKATIEGRLSAQAQIQWPALSWTGDFHLENIEVEGAVPQVYALRKGALQHRIHDHEGDAILRETGEGSADWVALREVAAPMRHAVIAAEDIRFTEHPGYDMTAMREALAANKAAGKVLRGGSSLSQQLAKNLYLDGQRTLVRKIRELLLAIELDRTLGKGRILELYLNVVEWGPGIYGIQAASERYFMRRPSQLQPHEAAFLAAILPNPKRFYREQYLKEKARETRIDWILSNMGDAGKLSAAEVKKWTEATLRFVPPPAQ